MRALTKEEFALCSGGELDGQCMAEMGLNYLITGAALATTLASGGILGVGAIAGAAYSWSSWWRDCGPKHDT